MGKQLRILVVIPKVDKTELAVFLNETCIYKKTLIHVQNFPKDESTITADVLQRVTEVMNDLHDAGINVSKINAVSAVGGLLKPIEGGTYYVTEQMILDLKSNYSGKHISNLGGLIASSIANQLNIEAFIVDPPVVNEFAQEATFTGIPTIKRKSVFHALNQKAVARFAAKDLNKSYEDLNLIVCHLGIGITVGAHRKGKVIDVNNGLHGDGPFSIERAGSVPVKSLLELCQSSEYNKEQLKNKLTFESGLKAYLQMENVDEILNYLKKESKEHEHIIQAMTYQVAKEIGSMATVLKGNVDGIVLTGQLARFQQITTSLIEQTSWIADLFIYPGEYDLQALYEGTLRVLRGEEKAKYYS